MVNRLFTSPDAFNSVFLLFEHAMAEAAIGLAAGILPLFKTCLDYLQLYKTAQASSRESRILLYMLDCEHENFLIWGEKHGAFKEQVADGCDTESGQLDKVPKVREALELIQDVLSDANKLREKYGVSVSNTISDQTLPQEPYPSNSGLKRLKWFRRSRDAQSHGLVQKTVWAINDKIKFKELITYLHGLVDSLYNILPVPLEERNAVAIEDIRPIATDPERLEDFEKASKDAYPEWSSAASVMRETGSTISQWVSKVEDNAEDEDEVHQRTKNDVTEMKDAKGISLYEALVHFLTMLTFRS